MRRTTKATAVLLTAAMSIGVLAGCGAQQSTSKESDIVESSTTESSVVESSGVEESAEPAEPAEPVEMTTVTWWSTDAHEKECIQRLVTEFNNTTGKEKGIFIEYKAQSGISQTVELALQSGIAPDIFNTGNIINMAAEGYILAIEDLPGGEEILASYDEIPVDCLTEGKTYRLPTTATTLGLLYNKDLFKAAGLVDENGEATPPATFEELREYAKILTNEAERTYGIIWPWKWGGWYDSDINYQMQQIHGYLNCNYATGEFDYTDYKPLIEIYTGIYADGSVYPGADSIDNDTARALFAEGVVGMKFAFSFDVGVLNDQFPAKCDWGVAPLPTLEEDVRYGQMMTVGYSPFINASSEVEPEKLAEVYKFIISDEVATARYLGGYALPADAAQVGDAELGEDAPKGWKEFKDMASISVIYKNPLGVSLTGDNAATVVKSVIMGEISVDDAIADLNKRYNEGVTVYYENNPDKKELHYSTRVLPDWKPVLVDLSVLDK